MNEKAKRPGGEDILEVFRSDGDRDISAENYLLKKRTLSPAAKGPLRKNQILDSPVAPALSPGKPHTLNLSSGEAACEDGAPADATDSTTDAGQQLTAIRLETFRIDLQDRLAAMQVAQQKAKDQLNELKKQNPPEDEPPAD